MPSYFQFYNINKLKYLHYQTPISYREITENSDIQPSKPNDDASAKEMQLLSLPWK